VREITWMVKLRGAVQSEPCNLFQCGLGPDALLGQLRRQLPLARKRHRLASRGPGLLEPLDGKRHKLRVEFMIGVQFVLRVAHRRIMRVGTPMGNCLIASCHQRKYPSVVVGAPRAAKR